MSKNAIQNLVIFGSMIAIVGIIVSKRMKQIKSDIKKNW